MKISIIFGTRPEAIKLAPVILRLRREPRIQAHVCVTAQHREMLDQVLRIFEIVPDRDLNLMSPDQTLADLTALSIQAIDAYLSEEKPDAVLVQGDTTTVLASALTAFYHKIPLAHVEAGLRTGNMYSPWPEEANRVLTSRLAEWHFAPTERNRQNLIGEGVDPRKVYITGNTVIDALFLALEKVKSNPPHIPGLPPGLLAERREEPLVLITGHRRESFGEGFEAICRAIGELARRFPHVQFVYPVHLNPNVRRPVLKFLGSNGGGEGRSANVHLLDPLPYLPFVAMMDRAAVILTDSGGIQEEAPSLGKPVLVMRDTTERPEAVEAGTARLVGSDYDTIVRETSALLENPGFSGGKSLPPNPYGDGRATERIIRILAGKSA